MDMNDFWQENKRFLVTIGSGLLTFLIGLMLISSSFSDEKGLIQNSLRRSTQSLQEGRFTSSDEELAEEENSKLEESVDILSKAVAFVPREPFRLQPDGGSAGNQYFGRQDQVRQDLRALATRNRMALPDGLDLEMVESTREEIMVRRLEMLDLIDRVVRFAIDADIERIHKIKARRDSRLGSKHGDLGRIERSTVQFEVYSSADDVVEWLALSQSDEYGHALPFTDLEIATSRSKGDEVRCTITFLIVRLHDVAREEEV